MHVRSCFFTGKEIETVKIISPRRFESQGESVVPICHRAFLYKDGLGSPQSSDISVGEAVKKIEISGTHGPRARRLQEFARSCKSGWRPGAPAGQFSHSFRGQLRSRDRERPPTGGSAAPSDRRRSRPDPGSLEEEPGWVKPGVESRKAPPEPRRGSVAVRPPAWN